MTNRKSTTGFPTSCRWSAYVTPKSPKVDKKSIFSVFNKIQFQSNKVCYKVSLCKTSSGKVVEQSSSYEITEKYRTESVSFHLKYWLKLTYPVVASMSTASTAAHSAAE